MAEQGYDVELFLDAGPILLELVCSICEDIVRGPVSGVCGHLFCERCLRNWIYQRKKDFIQHVERSLNSKKMEMPSFTLPHQSNE